MNLTSKASWGFSSVGGTLSALASLLVLIIDEARTDAALAPFGVSPETWIIITALLGGIVIIGRFIQNIADYVSKVTIGWTTIGTVIVAVAGMATVVVSDLAGVLNPLGVSPDVWALASASVAAAAFLGRMLVATFAKEQVV